ncbi:hypothetical protein H696_00765 [Fonticula alba]|uniref:EamA domain-containing protein n=1 Tax=Fonticula alba TaxID=691883 RepID=A0A058ZH12_FONAL|nr:hypothetical protein H696_00765 [Fonticula alba]KCV73223.1 hypothetical protein H696_00765 [Fonticula alba]|eukprot:XP_009492924.1 hypothetical protein H696_00765 [Fonticula alba]
MSQHSSSLSLPSVPEPPPPGAANKAGWQKWVVFPVLVATMCVFGGYSVIAKVALEKDTDAVVMAVLRDFFAVPLLLLAGWLMESRPRHQRWRRAVELVQRAWAPDQPVLDLSIPVNEADIRSYGGLRGSHSNSHAPGAHNGASINGGAAGSSTDGPGPGRMHLPSVDHDLDMLDHRLFKCSGVCEMLSQTSGASGGSSPGSPGPPARGGYSPAMPKSSGRASPGASAIRRQPPAGIPTQWPLPDRESIFGLLLLGGCLVLNQLCYALALARVSAVHVAALQPAVPVITMAIACSIGAERARSWMGWALRFAGTACAAAGALLVALGPLIIPDSGDTIPGEGDIDFPTEDFPSWEESSLGGGSSADGTPGGDGGFDGPDSGSGPIGRIIRNATEQTLEWLRGMSARPDSAARTLRSHLARSGLVSVASLDRELDPAPMRPFTETTYDLVLGSIFLLVNTTAMSLYALYLAGFMKSRPMRRAQVTRRVEEEMALTAAGPAAGAPGSRYPSGARRHSIIDLNAVGTSITIRPVGIELPGAPAPGSDQAPAPGSPVAIGSPRMHIQVSGSAPASYLDLDAVVGIPPPPATSAYHPAASPSGLNGLAVSINAPGGTGTGTGTGTGRTGTGLSPALPPNYSPAGSFGFARHSPYHHGHGGHQAAGRTTCSCFLLNVVEPGLCQALREDIDAGPAPIITTAWAYGFATLLMCIALLGCPPGLGDYCTSVRWAIPTEAWYAILYGAVGCSALGFGIVSWASGKGGVSAAGVTAFWPIQPVASAALSALVLGYILQWTDIVGAALVAAGTLLVSWIRAREEAQESAAAAASAANQRRLSVTGAGASLSPTSQYMWSRRRSSTVGLSPRPGGVGSPNSPGSLSRRDSIQEYDEDNPLIMNHRSEL